VFVLFISVCCYFIVCVVSCFCCVCYVFFVCCLCSLLVFVRYGFVMTVIDLYCFSLFLLICIDVLLIFIFGYLFVLNCYCVVLIVHYLYRFCFVIDFYVFVLHTKQS